LKLKEDIAVVKPTQLICVPRIYNRMIEAIFSALGG
jgi:long-subunit acyl-CoA synthetase (AMP-forming)